MTQDERNMEEDVAAERRPLLPGGGSGGASPSRGSPSTGSSGAGIVVHVAPPLPSRMDSGRGAGTSGRSGLEPSDRPEPRTCRICFESEDSPEDADPDNPLISPCLCKGSSRYVHRHCLAQWRASTHRQDAAYQCEVCKFRYRYARAWWASILGSRAMLASVFTLVIAALVAALGFVPTLGSTAQDAWGPAAVHVANGVVNLGILGLVASLVLGLLRAFGALSMLWLPDPWCPAVLCLDCNGSSLPLAMEVGAGECGVALAAILGVLLVAAGVVASALLTWRLLLVASAAALSRAQHMVENIGDVPPPLPRNISRRESLAILTSSADTNSCPQHQHPSARV